MPPEQKPSTAPRTPSVRDVAAAAGVSVGTVSSVLNRPSAVREATRRRVEKAIAELGFTVNEPARQLRAGRSHTLGYVMADAANPFFTDVAAGMERAAKGTGLSLFLCNSGNSPSSERWHLESLQQLRVQGILLTPVDLGSINAEFAMDQGTPVVMVGGTVPRAGCAPSPSTTAWEAASRWNTSSTWVTGRPRLLAVRGA